MSVDHCFTEGDNPELGFAWAPSSAQKQDLVYYTPMQGHTWYPVESTKYPVTSSHN